MGKRSTDRSCSSASHRLLKVRAKARVDDLQVLLSGLQCARKEGRAGDAAVMEGQINLMLQEWKVELGEASPASSALSEGNGGGRSGSDLSLDIQRLLQLCEEGEEEGVTSRLVEVPLVDPKMEPVEDGGGVAAFHEDYYEFDEPGLGADQYKRNLSMGLQHALINCLDGSTFQYQQFSLYPETPCSLLLGTHIHQGDLVTQISDLIPAICPPPSAFLRPKCALWDCPRPAQGSEWWHDYCSNFHATLAFHEGPPGMAPVLRPGGIDLKDGPLFAALSAKTQGKNVGIPECEGAATTKSPWNAPELFDLIVLKGESLREWLFFDKPRKAFESGSRKQRSLPDYSGRGWHESRKQVMKEFGGLKRSYYMDPQPIRQYEWHLYEYEISNCDACALYRLELKLVDPNKNVKGKVNSDSLVDLQQQMGRLNAETPVDNKRYVKARSKANQNDVTDNVYSATNILNPDEAAPLDQMSSVSENLVYGPSLPFGYSVQSLGDYYGT